MQIAHDSLKFLFPKLPLNAQTPDAHIFRQTLAAVSIASYGLSRGGVASVRRQYREWSLRLSLYLSFTAMFTIALFNTAIFL